MATQIHYGDLDLKKNLTVAGKVIATGGTASNELATKGQVDASYSTAILRSSHTGTQLSSTISDFNTAVNALIDTAMDALIGGAPSTFDTLKEISDWIAANDTTDLIADVAANTAAIADLQDAVENLQAGGVGSYKQDIGDGVASTFTVTHSLATLDVAVEVIETTGNRQTVFPVITRPSTNTVTVDFDGVIIASGSHRVLIRVI